MGAFEYQALDTTGQLRKGVLEGDTARQVRQQLRDQGLAPLQVEEVVRKEHRTSGFSLQRGISATELALFTRQLATLTHSGLPLEEALKAVAQQTERGRLKSIILGIRARVTEGHPLATGMADFPQAFPELYRATVAAGEQTGHLDAVLERLADFTEARQQMRQKIALALFYPAILTLIALLVVGGLLTFVVPDVVEVFEHVGQQLPLLTRGLIAVSDFLRAHLLLLLFGLFVLGLGLWWLFRHAGPRLWLHRQYLRLPLIGRLTRGLNAARFARTFSILTSSGVPALEAMQIAGSVVSNLPMQQAIEIATGRVREGSGIRAALDQSGNFPPMMLHLIASGETGGNLEEMLDRAAANQEREIETLIAALLGVFEPLLILVMGGLVLMIVLAILMPIIELNQLVQ